MSCWLTYLMIGLVTFLSLLDIEVSWMSLSGPSCCDDSSRQVDESQKRQPYSATLHRGSAALPYAETALHWLLSWRVHLQHYQTCSILCSHLTTQVNEIKLSRDLTWLAWLGNSIDLDTSPQLCEYTSAFTIVLLRGSLDLRLVHSVLSRYFSTSLYIYEKKVYSIFFLSVSGIITRICYSVWL